MISFTSILRASLPLATATTLGAIAAPSANAADFQQYLQGNCSGTVCTVDFDKVPAGKKLRVTKSSCYIRVFKTDNNPYEVLHAVQLLLVKANGSIGMAETLPAEFTTYVTLANGMRTVHQSNELVEVTAKGGQHLRAYVELVEGTFEQVACHISGKLS